MYDNRIDLGFPMALVGFLARVGSVMSITLLLLLFKAEALNPSEIAPREWFGLVFFPIGVIIGLAIASRLPIVIEMPKPFYFVYGYLLQYHVGGWAFVVFASPVFLFFFHWVLRQASHEHAVS